MVLYLPVRTTEQRKNKLAPEWEDDIFVGLKDSSNSYFVGNEDGVFKASQVKRVPESDRFEQARLKTMAGTPWQMEPREGSDLTTALPAVVTIPVSTGDTVPDVLIPESVPRQIHIRIQDLEKYGYTKGCARCEPLRTGRTTTAQHSTACRKRIEEAMQADQESQVQERVKATVARRNEFIEKSDAEEVAGQQANKARVQSQTQAKPQQPSASTPGADEAKKRRVDTPSQCQTNLQIQNQSQANPSTSAFHQHQHHQVQQSQ